jgi:N-acetylmuramoyl-L-alanine amidase
MWLRFIGVVALFTLGSSPVWCQSAPVQVTAVRSWSFNELTRIVIETSAPCEFKAGQLRAPERLFLDLAPARPLLTQQRTAVGDSRVRQIRVAEAAKEVTRVVFDLVNQVDYRITTLEAPDRIIVEIQLKGKPGAVPVASLDNGAPGRAKVAEPTGIPEAANMSTITSAAEGTMNSHPAPFRSAPMLSLAPETPGIPVNALLKFTYPPEPPRREVEFPGDAPDLSSFDLSPSDHGPSSVLTAMLELDPMRISPLPPASVAFGRSVGQPSTNVSVSLTRTLGLKMNRLVIDPGHGGPDQGAVGAHGLREKDVVLDIALRLADIVRTRLGAEVILTRTDDTLIPLQSRTALANDSKADIFLSIHANSSPFPSVAGTETYFLNLTASSGALELAARENADSSKAVGELQDLLRSITLNDKIEESSILARDIEKTMGDQSVRANARAQDRGVKRAPFVVLIGASMPSVLAEVGFLTNSRDEASLNKPEYRQKIAEALFRGIEQYNRSLSHFAAVDTGSEPSGREPAKAPFPVQIRSGK